MIDVKGRWALITGAARGIGKCAALFMAKQGCNLILHGRTAEHCADVLAEVYSPLFLHESIVGFETEGSINDRRSGRNFSAGNFYGMTLEEAVRKAENGFPVYTGSVAYV